MRSYRQANAEDEHYQAFFHPDKRRDRPRRGDFDVDAALALFDRQFGTFPKAARPIPHAKRAARF